MTIPQEVRLARHAGDLDELGHDSRASAGVGPPGMDGQDGSDLWAIPPTMNPAANPIAASVPFTPQGSIAATNVQAAIVEVRDESLSTATLAATGDMPYLGPITNYALASLGASASDNGSFGSYPSSNLIDGDDSTMYHPNMGAGAVATINLGVARTIDRWRILMSSTPEEIPAAWILQYSIDGSTSWTTLDTVPGPPSGGDKGIRTFSVTTARYWRIVQSGSVAWDARVNTVGLYGVPIVLATPSTPFSRSLLDDPDAQTARQTLGIASGVPGPPGDDGDGGWWLPGPPGPPAAPTGTGSPEGVVTAPVGSLYLRRDGGAGTTLYVKESGTGNTGWIGK